MPFKIINDYFDDFMNKRYDKIKSRLQCTEQELHDAVEHIQHLNPRPGEGFLDKFQTVVPDLIVRKSGNSWIITTNDGNLPDLRISKDYINFDNEHAYDKNAKKFIQERLNSAEWFIDAIKQRKKTLISVTKSIIKFQPEWFYGEIDFLNPLKLQDVAEDIKMDISTISRSTRGKFIDTPYGIFELKYFFTDSIKLKDGSIIGTFVIKKSLEKIIKAENKRHPYNDEILVKKLADIGYELARRTIAKYRDQMGYPVARLRKKI
jgi:RNA polymerase sigma-54 factor